jgi:hypothetical protein
MSMTEIILCSFIVIFFPLLPAYILYKTLPSTASVSGPFQGLTINLTGAFGGYFILVLLLLGLVTTRFTSSKYQYDSWRVKGTAGFQQTANVPDVRAVSLFIRPPNPVINEDGSFEMEVLAKKGSDFPFLIVDHPGFKREVVSLRKEPDPYANAKPYVKEYDDKTKQIIIKTPVLLQEQKRGSYSASGAQTPQPID